MLIHPKTIYVFDGLVVFYKWNSSGYNEFPVFIHTEKGWNPYPKESFLLDMDLYNREPSYYQISSTRGSKCTKQLLQNICKNIGKEAEILLYAMAFYCWGNDNTYQEYLDISRIISDLLTETPLTEDFKTPKTKLQILLGDNI